MCACTVTDAGPCSGRPALQFSRSVGPHQQTLEPCRAVLPRACTPLCYSQPATSPTVVCCQAHPLCSVASPPRPPAAPRTALCERLPLRPGCGLRAQHCQVHGPAQPRSARLLCQPAPVRLSSLQAPAYEPRSLSVGAPPLCLSCPLAQLHRRQPQRLHPVQGPCCPAAVVGQRGGRAVRHLPKRLQGSSLWQPQMLRVQR